MTASEPRFAITEIDLHAYADGLLDDDPRRKRAVAAFLRGHPDAAERVESYAAQNSEIQRLYAPVLDEPVPARLQAALHRRTGIAQGPWLRVAASVAVIMAAAASGWLLGIEQGRAPTTGMTRNTAAPATGMPAAVRTAADTDGTADTARCDTPRIAIHGNAPTLPLAGADTGDTSATRRVAPEPAVVAPTDPLGPIRVTR
jgi:anti-sigma factor RsiW